MTHRPDEVVVGSAAIILDDRLRVLLTKRGREPRKGYWHLPGGGVEFGEYWIDTVRREVREELGIDLAFPSPTPATVTQDIIVEEGRHVICAHFVAAIASGEPEALDATDDWRWFTEDQARELAPLLPSSIAALREVLGWDI